MKFRIFFLSIAFLFISFVQADDNYEVITIPAIDMYQLNDCEFVGQGYSEKNKAQKMVNDVKVNLKDRNWIKIIDELYEDDFNKGPQKKFFVVACNEVKTKNDFKRWEQGKRLPLFRSIGYPLTRCEYTDPEDASAISDVKEHVENNMAHVEEPTNWVGIIDKNTNKFSIIRCFKVKM